MKKLFTLLFIGIFCIGCSSDSSSDSGGNFSDTPLAKAEFDGSNLGIYKGIFTGSSGVMTVNLMNDGTVGATLILDGVTHNFTTAEVVPTEGNIDGLTFTSGNMSFDLHVSQNGENVEVSNINFPGHEMATLNLLKEYHDILVRCYEGSHSGGGILNIVISDDYITGLVFTPGDEEGADWISGFLDGTTLSGTYGEGEGTFNGTLSGNNISGTWQSSNQQQPASGTWSCRRAL